MSGPLSRPSDPVPWWRSRPVFDLALVLLPAALGLAVVFAWADAADEAQDAAYERAQAAEARALSNRLLGVAGQNSGGPGASSDTPAGGLPSRLEAVAQEVGVSLAVYELRDGGGAEAGIGVGVGDAGRRVRVELRGVAMPDLLRFLEAWRQAAPSSLIEELNLLPAGADDADTWTVDLRLRT